MIRNIVHVMRIATEQTEEPPPSKKAAAERIGRLRGGNHVHMVALYTAWYNFARVNSAVRMSPVMACGLADRLWDAGDIVKLIEASEALESVPEAA